MMLDVTALRRTGTATCVGLALAVPPAAATSPDAWDDFRRQVATSCAELAMAGDFKTVTVEVDPFGTQSYGVALISGILKKGLGSSRAICVVDKKTGKAEIGAESSGWMTISPQRR